MVPKLTRSHINLHSSAARSRNCKFNFSCIFVAASLVRKGDTVGWGVVFPNDDISDAEEQIVVCYLTINRDVILTRALIQPAGGLFATVVLPYGCKYNYLYMQ